MQKAEYAHYAEILKANLAFIKQTFHVSELGIFGSYMRGEQDEQSDRDILVRYNKVIGATLWVLAGCASPRHNRHHGSALEIG